MRPLIHELWPPIFGSRVLPAVPEIASGTAHEAVEALAPLVPAAPALTETVDEPAPAEPEPAVPPLHRDALEDAEAIELPGGALLVRGPDEGPGAGIDLLALPPRLARDADALRRIAEDIAEARAAMPDPETPLSDTLFDWRWQDAAARPERPRPETAPEPAPAPAGTLFTAADFTGDGQTVVVIDDGYSLAYDQSATVAEYDFAGLFNDPSARTFGTASHGSWVAQTVTGEASGVDIVHLKVFSDSGAGASLIDIEEALQAVIANADAYDIAAVNLSLGFGNATEETLTRLSDEFAALDALGIVSVAAAGNAGASYEDGVNVIAADPNVIGVSAVDEAGAFADFSQTSESLTDIAAPGVDVGVETVGGAELAVSGTSFAAPAIAGIAARLDEAALALLGEDLDDEEVLEILQASGSAVEGAPEAEGYRVADGDAAVEYFLANAEDYGDLLIA